MKYKCLILDHDDTIVESTKYIHYPSFVKFMDLYHPEQKYSLEEYIKYSFDPGFFIFLEKIVGLTNQEYEKEHCFWLEFVKNVIPKAFDGVKEVLDEYVKQGGIITVVSHSDAKNIYRDYKYNNLPTPTIVLGSEQPKEERKPSSFPINKILKELNLKKDEVLVIDDLKPGLVMANEASVDFAAALWCFDIQENKEYMLKNAKYCLENIEQFKELILK